MKKEFPDFQEFDWDEGNLEKNLKHGVGREESEQVFFNKPLRILADPKHSDAEERVAAFGRTNDGRRLTVIYTLRGTKIRIISARDMSRRERQFYEEAEAQGSAGVQE